MPMLILLLLFAEIAILIKLGQAVGGTALLVELLASGVLGWILLRLAGRAVARTRDLIGMMADPREYVRRSGLTLFPAGVLLILPGILSDILGIVLAVRFLIGRGRTAARRPRNEASDVIDVEYRVHDDDST